MTHITYELKNKTAEKWCPKGGNIPKHRLKCILKKLQYSGRNFVTCNF